MIRWCSKTEWVSNWYWILCGSMLQEYILLVLECFTSWFHCMLKDASHDWQPLYTSQTGLCKEGWPTCNMICCPLLSGEVLICMLWSALSVWVLLAVLAFIQSRALFVFVLWAVLVCLLSSALTLQILYALICTDSLFSGMKWLTLLWILSFTLLKLQVFQTHSMPKVHFQWHLHHRSPHATSALRLWLNHFKLLHEFFCLVVRTQK